MEKKLNDIPLSPVESSNVAAIGYDEASKRMAVSFKSGGLYHYLDVDRKAADSVLEAKSAGSAVRAVLIQGGYKYERLDTPKAKE